MITLLKILSLAIETFFAIGAGLSIIGIRLKLKKIAYMGCVFGMVIYGVRRLYEIYHIPLGTHSFIIIIFHIIILKVLGKQKLFTSIIATLISFLLLVLGEGIFMINVFRLFNISFDEIMSKSNVRLIGTFLTDIPLIIVFIIGYILKFSIIDINRLSENEEV